MSLLVVGSVALDTIETPQNRVKDALGGSATHFALASSLLTETRLVANIGPDFPDAHLRLLRERNMDLRGLKVCEGKTFRWHGRYLHDMNTRETVSVELNVFGRYKPEIPPEYRDSTFVFLANGAPAHQIEVLEALPQRRFVVVDTMDHWIDSQRSVLEILFKAVDAVVVNESEAHLLTGLNGLRAAEAILGMGPSYVIVKKGEHGAVMVGQGQTFLIPAYPTPAVCDPTGAGDTFAGGLMGYLSRAGEVTPAALRAAVAYGTVLASFNVEEFGVRRLATLTLNEVEERLAAFRAMTAF